MHAGGPRGLVCNIFPSHPTLLPILTRSTFAPFPFPFADSVAGGSASESRTSESEWAFKAMVCENPACLRTERVTKSYLCHACEARRRVALGIGEVNLSHQKQYWAMLMAGQMQKDASAVQVTVPNVQLSIFKGVRSILPKGFATQIRQLAGQAGGANSLHAFTIFTTDGVLDFLSAAFKGASEEGALRLTENMAVCFAPPITFKLRNSKLTRMWPTLTINACTVAVSDHATQPWRYVGVPSKAVPLIRVFVKHRLLDLMKKTVCLSTEPGHVPDSCSLCTSLRKNVLAPGMRRALKGVPEMCSVAEQREGARAFSDAAASGEEVERT